MYYLVTVGYETEQIDRDGNARLQKVKYVVDAESVEETTIIMGKYRGGDARASEILSISQLPVECVIGPKTTPEFYKKQ
jgi:hypothetical protein